MGKWSNYGKWRHPILYWECVLTKCYNKEFLNKLNPPKTELMEIYDEHFSIEKQKKIMSTFEELLATEKKLALEVTQKGWIQRNALISHVYSNYQKHEELLARKKEWEDKTLKCNIHRALIDLIQPYRDLYGYFPEQEKVLSDVQCLYDAAIRKDEFEIAKVIYYWLCKLK